MIFLLNKMSLPEASDWDNTWDDSKLRREKRLLRLEAIVIVIFFAVCWTIGVLMNAPLGHWYYG